tara:strand:- start:401 stop:652 length:252 start_codon:yes stop_codon:yes gene_type:complete
MMQLRENIIKALIDKFEGEISAHKINVEIMLENTVGVGDHPNITETIEQELETISKYDDKLNVLKKYFTDKSFKKNNKKVLNG